MDLACTLHAPGTWHQAALASAECGAAGPEVVMHHPHTVPVLMPFTSMPCWVNLALTRTGPLHLLGRALLLCEFQQQTRGWQGVGGGQQPQHVIGMVQPHALGTLVTLAQVKGCPSVVCEELLTLPLGVPPQVLNDTPHTGSQVILSLLLEQLDQGPCC